MAAIFALAQPAYACRSQQSESYALLPALPETLPEGHIILRVEPLDEELLGSDMATARVVEVVAGDWNSDVVEVRFPPLTSCSRRISADVPLYVVGIRSAVPGRLNISEYRLAELNGYEELPHGEIRFKVHDD